MDLKALYSIWPYVSLSLSKLSLFLSSSSPLLSKQDGNKYGIKLNLTLSSYVLNAYCEPDTTLLIHIIYSSQQTYEVVL